MAAPHQLSRASWRCGRTQLSRTGPHRKSASGWRECGWHRGGPGRGGRGCPLVGGSPHERPAEAADGTQGLVAARCSGGLAFVRGKTSRRGGMTASAHRSAMAVRPLRGDGRPANDPRDRFGLERAKPRVKALPGVAIATTPPSEIRPDRSGSTVASPTPLPTISTFRMTGGPSSPGGSTLGRTRRHARSSSYAFHPPPP